MVLCEGVIRVRGLLVFTRHVSASCFWVYIRFLSSLWFRPELKTFVESIGLPVPPTTTEPSGSNS